MRTLLCMAAGLTLFGASAKDVIENFTVPAGQTVTFSNATQITDTLTVNGKLIIGSSAATTAKYAMLDGGPGGAPAEIFVNGGSSSTFNAQQVVIGASGGCGTLTMGNWYCGFDFSNGQTIMIHENASKTPGSDYIDFITVGDNKMYTGSGHNQ